MPVTFNDEYGTVIDTGIGTIPAKREPVDIFLPPPVVLDTGSKPGKTNVKPRRESGQSR